MPWLSVYHTRLIAVSAVPTPLFALEVHRAGMPGRPGASFAIVRSRGARQNEPLDCRGKTVLVVGQGRFARLALHYLARIAHGNAEAAAMEHRHIVLAVAERRNLRRRHGRRA